LGDYLYWAILRKLQKFWGLLFSAEKAMYINSDKKTSWAIYFGRFFHKPIWSHCGISKKAGTRALFIGGGMLLLELDGGCDAGFLRGL
jgi:hypothetical protein